MSIDETAIRHWADRHECRSNLPILVRRLIRETTSGLVSIRFPGNEAVDLAGLDGQVENEKATPKVPEGVSVWELGCNQDPRAKAEGDFRKRTDESLPAERAESSFVFVTPRRWNGKDDWLAEKRREGNWSSVHAYDAIDLETWLEEAPATSRWLGEKLGVASPTLKTPHEWWQGWATASDPPITMNLVSSRRHNERETLLSKLRDGNAVVPVQADDRSEAVAFVVATLIQADALDLLDRTLVATSGNARIPASSNRLIVVADLAEGDELDFGDRRNITIVRPYPKGRLDVREALLLSHVPSSTFRSELEDMGLPRDEAEDMAVKTGHSVPVLRRQLSNDPEVRRPIWARDRPSARLLLPFALAGSWAEGGNIDDQAVIQLLGELEDGDIARVRDDLLALEDAPIARYGNVNIVVSQLDALFAVGQYVERADLDRFFELVPELLGDRDPALDLPQDQWWMANVLGHERSYSGALLSGIGDTLCILSIYGNGLCGDRLGINVAHRAEQVVRALMYDANEERWLTIRGQLRTLAEASPTAFLDCLEHELRRPVPAISAIMGTVEGGISGECLRTELLWALELLAWQPAFFARVAEVVFDLRALEVQDNWSNSPQSTARSLFLAWLPATALGAADRMRVLRDLSARFRGPAIDVCISLLPRGGPGFASRTARPQWRELAEQVLEPNDAEVLEVAIEASNLMLDLVPCDRNELERFIEVATRLHPDDLERLVNEVERWADDAADGDKAELRHKLRKREAMRAYEEEEGAEQLVAALRRMEEALEPQDPTARHRWLFENGYVEWRALDREEAEGRLTWQQRETLVEEHRRIALAEIRDQLGDDAVLTFALSVKQPDIVAQLLVSSDTPPEIAANWVLAILGEGTNDLSNAFLRQVLWSASLIDLPRICNDLAARRVLEDEGTRQRFAEHLPGRAVGWEVAEALGEDVASAYWSSVFINIRDDTEPRDAEYAIRRLLEVNRPRSAFSAVAYTPERLPEDQWTLILQAIAYGEEPDGPFPDAYRLDGVFQHLDAAEHMSDEQIANLEMPFIQLLCNHGYRNHERTLAVHRQLARDPALFMQLVQWRYNRRDGGAEPDYDELPPERRKILSNLAYHTLEGWNEVPGCDADGVIVEAAFSEWAETALRLAAEVDRTVFAEIHLGGLLARFARRRSWDDWLPECILDFLNRAENSGLREKFDLGVSNARGVTTRSPYDGGAQERHLAVRYRELSTRYSNSHPRVSTMLISVAEDFERDATRHDDQAAVGERWRP